MDARRHWLCAGLLVVLATAVQGWCLARAEVPALDAVRYVGIAQSFSQHGWRATLADESEHPLFPALIWGCRTLAIRVVGDTPTLWITSAQFVAAAMLILAVVPLHFFALRAAGQWPALAAGVFYCLMSELANLGADALSDSTQLFFVACALWSLARHWSEQRCQEPLFAENNRETADGTERKRLLTPLFFFGGCSALATMARAESCLLLAACPLALLALQLRSTWRQPWLRCGAGLACAAAGWIIVTGPYLWSAGVLTPRAAMCRILGREQPEQSIAAALRAAPIAPSATATNAAWRLPTGEAATIGLKDRSRSTRFHGYSAAIRALATQLPVACNYWIGGLALCGMCLALRRPLRPIDLFLGGFALLYLAVVTHMAAGLGYLMPRHLLPLAVLILPPAGYAVCELPKAFFTLRRKWARRAERKDHVDCASRLVAVGLVSLASLACVPKLLVPPHASHAGHRAAGRWIASQAAGLVLDSRGWTALYSGRPTRRFDAAEATFNDPSLGYIVVEQRELEADGPRGRTLRHVLNSAAEPPVRFAPQLGKPADAVLVYRWRPERLASLAKAGG